jgi:hypothetical protein
MLIPTLFVLVANVGAIGVAMGKAVVYMRVDGGTEYACRPWPPVQCVDDGAP